MVIIYNSSAKLIGKTDNHAYLYQVTVRAIKKEKLHNLKDVSLCESCKNYGDYKAPNEYFLHSFDKLDIDKMICSICKENLYDLGEYSYKPLVCNKEDILLTETCEVRGIDEDSDEDIKNRGVQLVKEKLAELATLNLDLIRTQSAR